MKVFVDASLLIYLNAVTEPEASRQIRTFYLDLLENHRAYTGVLVLDGLIYFSGKRYSIPYEIMLEFIENAVLPAVAMLPLREEEFKEASKVLRDHKIPPSDALHIGVMIMNGIKYAVTEDKDFDKVPGIARIWIGNE